MYNSSSSYVSGDILLSFFELKGLNNLSVKRTGKDTFFIESNSHLHEMSVVVNNGKVTLCEVFRRPLQKDANDYFFGKPVICVRDIEGDMEEVVEDDTCIKHPMNIWTQNMYRNDDGIIVTGSDMYIASTPYTISSTNHMKYSVGWEESKHFGRSYIKNILTNVLTREETTVYTDLGYEPYFFALGGEMYYTRELEPDMLLFIRCSDGRILYNTSNECSSFSGRDFIVFCNGNTITVLTLVPELVLWSKPINGKSTVKTLITSFLEDSV